MSTSVLRPALVLAAWTFLVWTTRIRNIWTDDALTLAGQIGRTALALSFTLLALGVVAARLRSGRAGAISGARPAVLALAAWTVVVWAVRLVGIVGNGHSVGFVAVHAVLAVVSTVLALWSARAVLSVPAAHPAPA